MQRINILLSVLYLITMPASAAPQFKSAQAATDFRTSLKNKEAQKLVSILDQIDSQKTLLTPTMGGSLPIYLFEQALTAPIVILPIANHDNNQHGRNENMRLKNLWDAIEIYSAVITAFY